MTARSRQPLRLAPVRVAHALALLVAALLVPACASGPAPAAAPEDIEPAADVGAVAVPDAELPRLLVGSDLDNKPFAWVDAAGRPQGRDVEMMAAIAQLLHRRLEWQRMPFDQLMPAVQARRVDLVCATLGVTPERERLMAFSRPYFETEIVAVVRAGEGEPATLEALAGRRVAGAAGTTAERAVRGVLPGALGVFESKGLPAGERLLSHEVDAAVMDGPAAAALVAASDGKLVRLGQPLQAEHYALALPLSSEALRQACDRALSSLERAGSLARWNEKFGLAPAAAAAPSAAPAPAAR